MANRCINPGKKVLKSKKVIFKVANKTICEKKIQMFKNVSVGAGAGAWVVIRIYGLHDGEEMLSADAQSYYVD